VTGIKIKIVINSASNNGSKSFLCTGREGEEIRVHRKHERSLSSFIFKNYNIVLSVLYSRQVVVVVVAVERQNSLAHPSKKRTSREQNKNRR